MREFDIRKFFKKHLLVIVCLFATGSISLVLALTDENRNILIKKEGYGGEEQQVDMLLKYEEITEKFTLNVRPQKLTKKQTKEKMEEAFLYLDEHLRGKNENLSNVVTDLDFSLDYEKYPFDVEIRSEDYLLVNEEGIVKNEKEELATLGYGKKEQKRGIDTKITIILWYGEDSRQKTYSVKIYPPKESKIQTQFSKVKKQLLKKEEKALYKETLVLPNKIDGIEINRSDVNQIGPLQVLIIGIAVAGLLLLREKEVVKNKEKERFEQLSRSYPWFVNELTLLMGAGMQVRNVFFLLIEEYEKEQERKKHKKRDKNKEDYRKSLINELRWAKHSLEIGMAEEQVYYQLGRRFRLPCYIKLMTLLEQNVKRGTKGLAALFEQEERNALEERKNLAKRYGEEAGTKLLGPMILLLLVVMLMIMIPAFLSF